MNPTDTPQPQHGAASLRLTDLRPGAVVRVLAVDANTPNAARLLDLGFTPGTRVRVLRSAPLGDPIVYELRGMRLCLRRSEASSVEVSRE